MGTSLHFDVPSMVEAGPRRDPDAPLANPDTAVTAMLETHNPDAILLMAAQAGGPKRQVESYEARGFLRDYADVLATTVDERPPAARRAFLESWLSMRTEHCYSIDRHAVGLTTAADGQLVAALLRHGEFELLQKSELLHEAKPRRADIVLLHRAVQQAINGVPARLEDELTDAQTLCIQILLIDMQSTLNAVDAVTPANSRDTKSDLLFQSATLLFAKRIRETLGNDYKSLEAAGTSPDVPVPLIAHHEYAPLFRYLGYGDPNSAKRSDSQRAAIALVLQKVIRDEASLFLTTDRSVQIFLARTRDDTRAVGKDHGLPALVTLQAIMLDHELRTHAVSPETIGRIFEHAGLTIAIRAGHDEVADEAVKLLHLTRNVGARPSYAAVAIMAKEAFDDQQRLLREQGTKSDEMAAIRTICQSPDMLRELGFDEAQVAQLVRTTERGSPEPWFTQLKNSVRDFLPTHRTRSISSPPYVRRLK